jgi:hypothetical protein
MPQGEQRRGHLQLRGCAGSADAGFSIIHDPQVSRDRFLPQQGQHSRDVTQHRQSVLPLESEDNDAMILAGGKIEQMREIEIKREEDSLFLLTDLRDQ